MCRNYTDEMDHFDRFAEARYRKILESRPLFVWRRFADGEELTARAFFPEGHSQGSSIPSVMFFHGGMWNASNEVEFVPWALQLARYGIASILPEYRTKNRFEVQPADLFEEAGEAWQWIYENTAEMGLDPDRITLAGSDAGGLMALYAGMVERTVSRKWFRKEMTAEPQPAAIALFRGITSLESSEGKKIVPDPDLARIYEPEQRLRKGLPLLFATHGDHDKLIPWKTCMNFSKLWKKAKNTARFVKLDGADHAYYHFNVDAPRFEYVLSEWISFMSQNRVWDIEEEERDFLLV